MKSRNIGVDFNHNCPFRKNQLHESDNLFIRCFFIQEIWNAIIDYCLIPIKSDLNFIDRIGYIWKHQQVWANYIINLWKNLAIAWSIGTYRNNFIFKNYYAQLDHIIDLEVKLFEDMTYYSVVFRIFGQNGSWAVHTNFTKRSRLEICLRSPHDA